MHLRGADDAARRREDEAPGFWERNWQQRRRRERSNIIISSSDNKGPLGRGRRQAAPARGRLSRAVPGPGPEDSFRGAVGHVHGQRVRGAQEGRGDEPADERMKRKIARIFSPIFFYFFVLVWFSLSLSLSLSPPKIVYIAFFFSLSLSRGQHGTRRRRRPGAGHAGEGVDGESGALRRGRRRRFPPLPLLLLLLFKRKSVFLLASFFSSAVRNAFDGDGERSAEGREPFVSQAAPKRRHGGREGDDAGVAVVVVVAAFVKQKAVAASKSNRARSRSRSRCCRRGLEPEHSGQHPQGRLSVLGRRRGGRQGDPAEAEGL